MSELSELDAVSLEALCIEHILAMPKGEAANAAHSDFQCHRVAVVMPLLRRQREAHAQAVAPFGDLSQWPHCFSDASKAEVSAAAAVVAKDLEGRVRDAWLALYERLVGA